MKQIDKLYLALLIFMLLLLFSFSSEYFGQSLTGSGTEEDPYLIYDVGDLSDMNNYSYNSGLHFRQMNDISLADSAEWTPIWAGQQMRNFYDGQGYKIKHMNISTWTTSTQRYRGLFSRIGQNYTTGYSQPYPPPVKNIVFDSCTISYTITNYGYSEYTGFLAGDAYNSSLESAYEFVQGIFVDSTCVIDITGRAYRALIGGVVGLGCVEQSAVKAYIRYTATGTSDYTYVAGITGQAELVSDCVFSGRLEVTAVGDKYRAGGITTFLTTRADRLSVTGSFFGGLSGGTTLSQTYGAVIGRVFGTDYFTEVISAVDSVDISVSDWAYVLNSHESTASTDFESIYYSTDQAYRTGSWGAMYSGTIDTSNWRTTSSFLKNQDSLEANGFDFDNDWIIIPSINKGYPLPMAAAGIMLENVKITSKTVASNAVRAGSTVNLEWTGEGSYDVVTVNGIEVNDSSYSYTIPSDTSGIYEIKITARSNPTVSANLYYTVYSNTEVLIYYEGFEDYDYADDDISATNWKRTESSTISYAAIMQDGEAVSGMDYTVSRNNYFYGTVGNGSFNSGLGIEDTAQTFAFPGDTNFTYILRFDYVQQDLNINGRFYIYDSAASKGGTSIYTNTLYTLADTIYSIEDTLTFEELTDSSTMRFYGQSQNGRFSLDNIMLTRLAPLDVNITEPEEGDYVSVPFVVSWGGLGSYDSVRVNGVEVFDTTYTITSAPAGWYDIGIEMLEDTTVTDTVRVRVVEAGAIEIDSAYVEDNQINYLITTNAVDTVLFYIGVDTVGMTYVGMASLGDAIYNGTQTFDNPEGFFASGDLWFKVIESKDTSQFIETPTVTRIGNRGGSQVCWSPYNYDAIEVRGIKDLGCGWVSNITYFLTSSTLRIQNEIPPYAQSLDSDCPPSARPCNEADVPRYAFTYVDTLADDTTNSFFPDQSYYTNTGNANNEVIYNGRRYYIYSEDIYYDDLVNGRDTVFYIDLDQFYNPPYWSSSSVQMTEPYLTLMEYATPTVPVEYNGTEGLTAAMDDQYLLDTAVFIIHEPVSFQASWYFYPEFEEPNSTSITYDLYQNTGALKDIRNYFRGVHPKILKYGVR
jgi:hypothetical protein